MSVDSCMRDGEVLDCWVVCDLREIDDQVQVPWSSAQIPFRVRAQRFILLTTYIKHKFDASNNIDDKTFIKLKPIR